MDVTDATFQSAVIDRSHSVPVVVDFCPTLTEEQAKQVIATWLANGTIVQKEHVDPKDRHKKPGLFIGERPGNKWP